MTSYPIPVATLVERVRALAEQEGSPPSRNRIMSKFHVGARKANEALAELDESGSEPTSNPNSNSVEPRLTPVTKEAAMAGTGRRLDAIGDDDRTVSYSGSAPDSAPGPAIAKPSTNSGSSGPTATVTNPGSARDRRARSWPLFLLALPAFVAIWSGWVGLGGLTGFGEIHPLPGIADGFSINSAITLPIGVETYAAYALNVWLSGHHYGPRARRFAKWSALGSLALGALGQVAYHVMTAAGVTRAPWPVTTAVACLPVVVLGCGAALLHLVRASEPPTHAGS